MRVCACVYVHTGLAAAARWHLLARPEQQQSGCGTGRVRLGVAPCWQSRSAVMPGYWQLVGAIVLCMSLTP